jgi:hypothetical protein
MAYYMILGVLHTEICNPNAPVSLVHHIIKFKKEKRGEKGTHSHDSEGNKKRERSKQTNTHTKPLRLPYRRKYVSVVIDKFGANAILVACDLQVQAGGVSYALAPVHEHDRQPAVAPRSMNQR